MKIVNNSWNHQYLPGNKDSYLIYFWSWYCNFSGHDSWYIQILKAVWNSFRHRSSICVELRTQSANRWVNVVTFIYNVNGTSEILVSESPYIHAFLVFNLKTNKAWQCFLIQTSQDPSVNYLSLIARICSYFLVLWK